MAKGKGRVSSGGPRKNHGPKRKMFHDYGNKVARQDFGRLGLLSKYHCFDSFILSCQARGLKHGNKVEWESRFDTFRTLPTKEEKDKWLDNCKHYVDPSPKKTSKA